MKQIAIFGAGKSSSFAIKHLANRSDYQIHVVDKNTQRAASLFASYSNIVFHNIDIADQTARQSIIDAVEIIISLMPPSLHIIIAKDCLLLKKHLITASYISEEIKALDADVQESGLMFLCEMGLDPGIDHMSAREIIDEIETEGGIITSFLSHCGGLVAPESDTNPWHYKISWNPRNVVTAGAAGAHFLQDNQEQYIPHNLLFKQQNKVHISGIGDLAYYPNRDSLSYKEVYGLDNVHTLIRSTLRYPNYINAWHYIISLGLTNEKDIVPVTINSIGDWVKYTSQKENPKAFIQELCNGDESVMFLLDNLELFSNVTLSVGEHTSSADILQQIIEKKWLMQTDDKDMIVMLHEFEYEKNMEHYKRRSQLVVKGENNAFTAMAKTVGLPLAIFAEQLIDGNIQPIPGVQIPVAKEIYEIMLPKLAAEGIVFTD